MDDATVRAPDARRWATLRRWLGVEMDEADGVELAVSSAGAALAMLAIFGVSHHLLGLQGAVMLVASMAASAVLIFATPRGQLSQPWPVLVGQVTAAAVGVSCARMIGHREVAAALAVGLAILAMRLLKALHPPGGATALIAVVGGPAIRDLGYRFVLEPVLLNCAILLVAAVVLNLPFRWRRYPAHLARRSDAGPPSGSYDELVAAVRQLDSFVDVSEDDLMSLHRIFRESPPATG
jgi:CBS domain-containing membrane protein